MKQTSDETKQLLEQHKAISDKMAAQIAVLNTYMERMEQSSLRMERLSYVIALLTIVSVFWYGYEFLKDIGVAPISAASYILIFLLIVVLLAFFWINKTLTGKISTLMKGYFPFLIFPLIIIFLFYALPMDIQNRFAFDSQTHEWFTLFTSSFLHNSQDHLMNNVLGYLIGSFALYLAFRYQSDTKSLFFLISACVLIVPFVSSIVVYFLAPTILLSRGFSNIVFAIVGLFPAATLMFMKSRSWFVYFVAWLLLEVTAYLFFTSQPVWAVILLFGYVILFSFWGLKVKFFKKEHYSKQVAILYYLIIAPFILLLLGFPPNLIVDGSLVNEVAHYVGFQVGVAVGLVYLYKDYAKRALTKFNSLFNLQNKQ